jgi:predicted SprT family Zn-dependent metalloprotease
MKSTTELYAAFQRAYAFYNEKLFAGQLGDVVFTLARHKKFLGYFWALRFAPYMSDKGNSIHEIAINPDYRGYKPEDVLSTLVHEMVHYLHLQMYGPEEAAKNGGHPRSWKELMIARGLLPRSASKNNSSKNGTGRYVTHDIEPHGSFDRLTRQLLESGFRIPLASHSPPSKPKAQKVKSTIYACHTCEQKVRGTPGQHIVCGVCHTRMPGR